MTDQETKYRAMARQAGQKLTAYRPAWEKAAPRLVPDYERVVQLLADFAAIGAQVAGTGSAGYPAAKDKAEDLVGAAARRVVTGPRNVQPSQYFPALAKAAGYQKSELGGRRDENLVKALEALAATAAPVAAELAQERVPAAALKDLDQQTDAYRPLVGAPRGQVLAGSVLRTTGRQPIGQLRTAFGPLATRMDSPGEEDGFKTMAAEYKQARQLLAGGHGPLVVGRQLKNRVG